MSEEDQARDEIGKALIRVARIPRPTERNRILWDVMKYCAAALSVTIEMKDKI